MALFTAVILIGLSIGAALAYRPADKPQTDAELNERVAAYYRAGKVFDFGTMASFYSPARQLDEAAVLKETAAKRAREFAAFKEDTRKQLQESAESINAGTVRVKVDGDWAISSGSSTMMVGNTAAVVPLEELVWVRSGGQWWIYQHTTAEISAYGNPPDEMLRLLVKPSRDKSITIQSQPDSESPAPPSADAESASEQPGNEPGAAAGE